MAYIEEKTYTASKKIKYIFKKGAPYYNKYLIVIFSGFPKAGQSPRYNYTRSLSDISCNRLFILDDYGPSGCYYLGEKRNFSVEESVISLIKHISQKYNIEFSKIIAIGSSKGGYTSLYFGIKYGFGYIIAGAPQFYLGNYLFSLKNMDIAEYISGGNNSEHKQFLNRLLPEVIEKSLNSPRIFLLVGDGDSHYKEHLLPLVNILTSKNIEYRLDLETFSDHSNIGVYFIEYFRHVISVIINSDESKLINYNNPDEQISDPAKLKYEYDQLKLKFFKVQTELKTIKASTSFHIGNLIVKAIRQPGKNTLMLPLRMIKLLVGRY